MYYFIKIVCAYLTLAFRGMNSITLVYAPMREEIWVKFVLEVFLRSIFNVSNLRIKINDLMQNSFHISHKFCDNISNVILQ